MGVDGIEERTFGMGLALQRVSIDDIGVDIVFRDGEAGRELAFVSGGDNLAQDLQIAMLTPTGTDQFNVRFGFDGLRVLTSGHEPWLAQELLRLSVMKTMAVDARVKQIIDVDIVRADPATRRWRIEAEVETVLGDVRRATLGEVDGDA
jgi:hypothetical protein